MAKGTCARRMAGFGFPPSKQQSSNTNGICWVSNTVQACHCRPTLCALSVHSPSPVYTAEEAQALSWLICSARSTADHQHSRMTSLADDELSMHRTALWPCSSASRVCQPLSAKCRRSTPTPSQLLHPFREAIACHTQCYCLTASLLADMLPPCLAPALPPGPLDSPRPSRRRNCCCSACSK